MGGSNQGTSLLVADDVVGSGQPHCQSLSTLSFPAQPTLSPHHTLSLPYLILSKKNKRKEREKGTSQEEELKSGGETQNEA